MGNILYIFGAGGHGREIAWFAREAQPNRVIRFIVDHPRYLDNPAVSDIHLVQDHEFPPDSEYVLALGDPAARLAAAQYFVRMSRTLQPAKIIHPSAILAPAAKLAPGAVVAARAVLSDNVHIGFHSHVNIGTTLSHDVMIGDFVTIAPGVNIAGNVTVGDGAFIGVGATVINGAPRRPLTIGAGAFIAAGACVTADVAAGSMVAGIPATRKR